LVISSYWFVPLEAQKLPGLDSLRKKIDNYSVQKLVQGEPAITTSLSDAVTEVSFLDDCDPQYGIPLSVLPQDENGRFLLVRPGLYTYTMQSYCLRAGKYGPGKGDGYLYAPLKGKQSPIIHFILQRSANHPEIPQGDIQVLLWAILSKTKITSMSRSNQLTAATLLTPSEIYDLNGGALGLVPQSMLGKALDGVSPELRPVLEAEASLRNLLSQGDASYASLERVAVLAGESPPGGAGSRQVPRGRWSYHPDGYFIRHFPHSYSQTDIQIYVPERLRVRVDAQSRICSIADRQGNRLDWEYDDRAGPAELAGDPPLRAYAFRSIHFKGRNPARLGEEWQKSWEGVGWTFLAAPASETRPSQASGQFTGFDERRRWGEQHRAHLNTLAAGVKSVGGTPGHEASLDARNAALSLGHLAAALNQIVERGTGSEAAISQEALYLIKRAWMVAVAGPARKKTPEYNVALAGFPWASPLFLSMGAGTWPGWTPALLQRLPPSIESSSSPEMFDPSFNVATPGNTAGQRLGGSPRPSGGPACAGIIIKTTGDIMVNGQSFIPVGNPVIPDLNGVVIETGSKARATILMQDGSAVHLGSNTTISGENLCGGSGGPSYVNLGAGAAKAVLPAPPGKSFEVVTSNTAGTRGELRRPFRQWPYQVLLVSMSKLQEPGHFNAEDRAQIDELTADDEDTTYAQAAVVIINQPPEFMYVKVTKGTVQLIDSKGSARLLAAGEEFFKKWGEGANTAIAEKVTIRSQP
jgi:hypothetical protein